MRKQYATSLEESLIKRLKIQAAMDGKTSNQIIEEALKQYLGITAEEAKN
jgi:predicted DNA-binding protein